MALPIICKASKDGGVHLYYLDTVIKFEKPIKGVVIAYLVQKGVDPKKAALWVEAAFLAAKIAQKPKKKATKSKNTVMYRGRSYSFSMLKK